MVNPKLNTTNMCITNYNYESIHILTILNIECIELTRIGMRGYNHLSFRSGLYGTGSVVPTRNLINLHDRQANKKLCQFPVSVSYKSNRNQLKLNKCQFMLDKTRCWVNLTGGYEMEYI